EYTSVSTMMYVLVFFFSSRRRHTRFSRDWSSDVCSSDLRSGRGSKDGASRQCAAGAPAGSDVSSAAAGCPVHPTSAGPAFYCPRSEERRVGKQGRLRGALSHDNNT